VELLGKELVRVINKFNFSDRVRHIIPFVTVGLFFGLDWLAHWRQRNGQ
jgi:hypothetical protein